MSDTNTKEARNDRGETVNECAARVMISLAENVGAWRETPLRSTPNFYKLVASRLRQIADATRAGAG